MRGSVPSAQLPAGYGWWMAVGGAVNWLPLGGVCRALCPSRVTVFKNIYNSYQRTHHSRALLPVCASRNEVVFNQFKFCVPVHRQQLAKLNLGACKGQNAAGGQTQCRAMSIDGQEYQAKSKTTISENEHFTMVYRFQGIRFLRAISKLKILQTGITVALLPTVYYFYIQELVQYSLVSYITGLSGLAIVMLYSMSYYLRRFIGMLYLNDSGTTLMVSHLTFWGRRNNFYVPVKDVMPLGDTGDATNETILQFRRYNSTEVFYFTIKFGQIVDKQKFLQVFGGVQ
ncbi:transmembrane protein 186 isoform X2 [Pristis pectinata]|uniref:transmembrane protein 186 isoform X2 n=1 Tax=Pristis pectinata TaxID=685728 RepID=UPI00223E5C6A|nr:transmembrane protein 186 isoform X2 [Pristis pectinata]